MTELILSLREASSFLELVYTKSCLQAKKAEREELI
jgi:hypothetical protein